MPNQNKYPWLESYSPKISWDMEIPESTVYDMLWHATQDIGDSFAFDFLGKRMKWRDIHEAVHSFSISLQHLGVKKGDRVGLFLPNSPYFLVAYYAIARIGGVVVNYNPVYAEEELAFQIEDSKTDIMVTCDLHLMIDKIDRMLKQSRLKKVVVCSFDKSMPWYKAQLFKLLKGDDIAKIPHDNSYFWYDQLIHEVHKKKIEFRPVDIDPSADLAVMQYTGGTTGIPKGAMLSHSNIVANAHQAKAWLSSGGDAEVKSILAILPFFHVFAMTAVMNLAVVAGMEIIALPRFDLKQALKLIDKKKPDMMAAVPAILNAMNNYQELDRYDLGSLKKCISGGASLPIEVKSQFEERSGCVVVEGYGLTEASPVLCCNPVDGENKPGSIGLPFPQTIVQIVDVEDGETILPVGQRGELCAIGPQVMMGYWHGDDQSQNVLQDTPEGKRLHTGDIAIMDEDGYVFIVDRLKDVVITNGYNIYPRHVEEAIYKHPCVEECIVAGLPDKKRGEIVKAWVRFKKECQVSEEDLRKFLGDKLSPIEMPRRYEFRDEELPKTMIGKPSRKIVLAQELEKKK